MPRWHPWIMFHGSAEWGLDEMSPAAAVLKKKHIVQEWKENGKKVLFESF